MFASLKLPDFGTLSPIGTIYDAVAPPMSPVRKPSSNPLASFKRNLAMQASDHIFSRLWVKVPLIGRLASANDGHSKLIWPSLASLASSTPAGRKCDAESTLAAVCRRLARQELRRTKVARCRFALCCLRIEIISVVLQTLAPTTAANISRRQPIKPNYLPPTVPIALVASRQDKTKIRGLIFISLKLDWPMLLALPS